MNPRFSILTLFTCWGWQFHATDYQIGRSCKESSFPTQQAAQAEGERVVAGWRRGTDAAMQRAGGVA